MVVCWREEADRRKPDTGRRETLARGTCTRRAGSGEWCGCIGAEKRWLRWEKTRDTYPLLCLVSVETLEVKMMVESCPLSLLDFDARDDVDAEQKVTPRWQL